MLQSLINLALIGQPIQYDPTLSAQAFANLIMSQPNPQSVNQIKDSHGARWIHKAAYHGNLAHLRMLAYVGPAKIVDAVDDNGDTPLHWAIQPSGQAPASTIWRLTAVGHLLIFGADPDVQNLDGRTPLHLAATQRGAYHLAQSLLIFGASPKLKDNSDRTARDYHLAASGQYPHGLLLEYLEVIAGDRGWIHGHAKKLNNDPDRAEYELGYALHPIPEGITDAHSYRRKNPLFASVLPGYPNPFSDVQPEEGRMTFYVKTRRQGWRPYCILEAPFEEPIRGIEYLSKDLEGLGSNGFLEP